MRHSETYQLSKHALLRVLERTNLSPGQLLDRLAAGAVAWLPASMPAGHRHALVYCATSQSFVVAIILEAERLVKTVVELAQWENMYRTVTDIWRSLAIHAAAQEALRASSNSLAEASPSEDDPMDVRLVAKLDGRKGPKYETLLAKTEAQWTALLGSVPAERRYAQPGFLSKLAVKLLTVNAFAELTRRRLERHAGLVASADNLLLVFGPLSYPVPLLPQIDVGKGLSQVVDRLAQRDEKRKGKSEQLEKKRVLRQQERRLEPPGDEVRGVAAPEPGMTMRPATNRELFALLTRSRADNSPAH
jgi:hypothetical protein